MATAADHVDKLVELLQLGAEMRAVQRRFFKGERGTGVVAEAKRLERLYDSKSRYLGALLGINLPGQ